MGLLSYITGLSFTSTSSICSLVVGSIFLFQFCFIWYVKCFEYTVKQIFDRIILIVDGQRSEYHYVMCSLCNTLGL